VTKTAVLAQVEMALRPLTRIVSLIRARPEGREEMKIDEVSKNRKEGEWSRCKKLKEEILDRGERKEVRKE
jgi:hypothetical protein